MEYWKLVITNYQLPITNAKNAAAIIWFKTPMYWIHGFLLPCGLSARSAGRMKRQSLKTFYPGDVLCTAREIITLWVSRMVMMGQYCVGDIPFSDVYIHAMIQDGEGRKMSKSLGNGIDPLVAINSHGADAMRFTLASMTTETQDIRMPVTLMKLTRWAESQHFAKI